jgi:hypothetical protein
MSVVKTVEDPTCSEIGVHGEYIPSPEEIRQQCDEIRKRWSERERCSRSAQRKSRWVVPTFKVGRWI